MGQIREINPTCEKVQHLFLPWLDGDLSPQVVEDLESHVKECSSCSEAWEKYRHAVELLSGLDTLPVPERILARIRDRIARPALWHRLAEWFLPAPRRIPVPALATMGIALMAVVIFHWSPWSPSTPPEERLGPNIASRLTVPSGGIDALPVSGWETLPEQRILPGVEELMRPLKALEADQERRFATKATLQDDLVLNLRGSEDVFNRIQELVREVHGRMFLVGIRHLKSGRVVRSRVVIQIPMEKYKDVLKKIEGMGKVSHLFLERDTVPMPPDRLRIRLLAVASLADAEEPALQPVSVD